MWHMLQLTGRICSNCRRTDSKTGQHIANGKQVCNACGKYHKLRGCTWVGLQYTRVVTNVRVSDPEQQCFRASQTSTVLQHQLEKGPEASKFTSHQAMPYNVKESNESSIRNVKRISVNRFPNSNSNNGFNYKYSMIEYDRSLTHGMNFGLR